MCPRRGVHGTMVRRDGRCARRWCGSGRPLACACGRAGAGVGGACAGRTFVSGAALALRQEQNDGGSFGQNADTTMSLFLEGELDGKVVLHVTW